MRALKSAQVVSYIHYQFDSMSGGSAEYPNTIFFGWVMVRPVRAGEGPIRSGNFVFATTFLTVVTIVVQNKTWNLKCSVSQEPILNKITHIFFWSAEIIKTFFHMYIPWNQAARLPHVTWSPTAFTSYQSHVADCRISDLNEIIGFNPALKVTYLDGV